jgi:hypothetical protein
MRMTVAELRACKAPVRYAGAGRAPRRRRASPEHDAQVAVFAWAAFAVHREPLLELLHAVPNGEKRDWKVAQRLKAEGVKAGMPDLHLPVPRGGYAGLYIEMKSGRNRPTEHQHRKIALLEAVGHRVTVQRCAEGAIAEIEWYLSLGARQ